MSNVEIKKEIGSMLTTVKASFGDERDTQAIIEAIRDKIVNKLVDKFVEEHGDEVLAALDLETIKKKTNEKVTIQALKELVNHV